LAAAARRSEADCDYLRLLKIYISEACEARLGEKEKERDGLQMARRAEGWWAGTGGATSPEPKCLTAKQTCAVRTFAGRHLASGASEARGRKATTNSPSRLRSSGS